MSATKKPPLSAAKSSGTPAPKASPRVSTLAIGNIASPRTPVGAGKVASPGGSKTSPRVGGTVKSSPRVGGATSPVPRASSTSPSTSPRLNSTASPSGVVPKLTFKQQKEKDAAQDKKFALATGHTIGSPAGAASPSAAGGSASPSVMGTSGKSILVIATYAFPFHKWVYPEHTKVLFTSAANKKFIDATIKKLYSHIEYFDQFDTNGLVEWQAVQLHRTFKFTHVVCQAEQDIIRCARLRVALFGGVVNSGQSINSALSFRDKIMMKDRVRSKLPVPNYKKVDSATDLIQFIAQFGYPVVVKPTRGMGSVRTTAIRDSKQLEALLAPGLSTVGATAAAVSGSGSGVSDAPIDLMVETFVTGQMYHIDGCVHNGQVAIMWPSSYINDCMDYSAAGSRFLASYSLSASNPLVPRLRQCMELAIATLDCPKSFAFHGEVWHTADDKLVFCEMACRAGGAGVVPTILELFKVDLNKFSIQTQCGDKPTSPLDDCKNMVPANHAGWMLMYPRLGRLLSVPAACSLPGVLSYTVSAAAGSEFRAIAHCTVEIASFVVTGKSEKEITTNIAAAAEWFEKNTKWA